VLPWAVAGSGSLPADGVHGAVGLFEIFQIDFVAGFFDQNRLLDGLRDCGIGRAVSDQVFQVVFIF